jgi:release factor glutamine methyltransferase
MPSFDFNGMRLSVSGSVYEPAEDSFLLAKLAAGLKGRILDMGTGCGISALANAKANPGNDVIGADANPEAVSCASENAKTNGIKNARFVVSDFFDSLDGKFDGMIFNPPYLPTEYSDRLEGPLNAAFDGGKNGRRVLEPFLVSFDKYLNKGGTLLLLQSSLNGPIKTRKSLERLGYAVSFEGREDFFFESIWVVRAAKPE